MVDRRRSLNAIKNDEAIVASGHGRKRHAPRRRSLSGVTLPRQLGDAGEHSRDAGQVAGVKLTHLGAGYQRFCSAATMLGGTECRPISLEENCKLFIGKQSMRVLVQIPIHGNGPQFLVSKVPSEIEELLLFRCASECHVLHTQLASCWNDFGRFVMSIKSSVIQPESLSPVTGLT